MDKDTSAAKVALDERSSGSRINRLIWAEGRLDARQVVLVAAVVLALAAAVFAGVSGWQWFSLAHSDSLRVAIARDDVLRVGQQEVINFYSIDYRNPDQTINRQLDSATGSLHDLLVQQKDTRKQQISNLKINTTATVLDAAVTEIDDRAGTAKLMAIIQVSGTSGPPRIPVQGALNRTDTGWKLSDLNAVVLGSTGQ